MRDVCRYFLQRISTKQFLRRLQMVIMSQNKSAFVILGTSAEVYEDQRFEYGSAKYKPTIYFDDGTSEDHALPLGTYNSHDRVLEVINDIMSSYLAGESAYYMPKV